MYFIWTNPRAYHLSFSEIPLWWKYIRRYRSDESLVGHNVVSVIMYLIIQVRYSWMDYVKNLDLSSVIQRFISIQKKIFDSVTRSIVFLKKKIENVKIITWIQYRLLIWSDILQRYFDDVRQIWFSKTRMRRYHSSLKSLRIKIDEEYDVLYIFELKLCWICVDISVGFLFVIWYWILINYHMINRTNV